MAAGSVCQECAANYTCHQSCHTEDPSTSDTTASLSTATSPRASQERFVPQLVFPRGGVLTVAPFCLISMQAEGKFRAMSFERLDLLGESFVRFEIVLVCFPSMRSWLIFLARRILSIIGQRLRSSGGGIRWAKGRYPGKASARRETPTQVWRPSLVFGG